MYVIIILIITIIIIELSIISQHLSKLRLRGRTSDSKAKIESVNQPLDLDSVNIARTV